jgi:hypothetical protein
MLLMLDAVDARCCHPERSEGSLQLANQQTFRVFLYKCTPGKYFSMLMVEILRCAQDDSI